MNCNSHDGPYKHRYTTEKVTTGLPKKKTYSGSARSKTEYSVSLHYQQHGSNYHVGFALHSSMYMDYEEGTPEKTEKERRKIIWGYAEQRLAPGLHALLQGSFQSGTSRGCKSYAGAGLTWQCSPTTPDFPLHTNGPVNLHGKSPVQATDLYNPPYISFSKREHTI